MGENDSRYFTCFMTELYELTYTKCLKEYLLLLFLLTVQSSLAVFAHTIIKDTNQSKQHALKKEFLAF